MQKQSPETTEKDSKPATWKEAVAAFGGHRTQAQAAYPELYNKHYGLETPQNDPPQNK